MRGRLSLCRRRRYFLWRLLALAGGPGFRAEPYHWPLLVFLLPACLYPFASCCAHTFSSMSPRARHVCYFLDYGALSLYSLGEPAGGGGAGARGRRGRGRGPAAGAEAAPECAPGALAPAPLPAPRSPGCAFPYAAYSMPASWLHGRLHQLFVPAAALNSFLCTGLSCYSRCVLRQRWRGRRRGGTQRPQTHGPRGRWAASASAPLTLGARGRFPGRTRPAPPPLILPAT